jgi:hypothetical protein
MIADPTAPPSRRVDRPVGPAPRRTEPVGPKRTPGALTVLQSSRAPAQLSLFARPYGGR